MAKAGLLFVGTDDGIVLFSDPGGAGRWLRIGQELRARTMRAVWPAADTPLTVLAAAGGMGLQRSDDGGQSWRPTLDADIYSIAGHQRDPHALYLGAADGAVYRSGDAGVSWELCNQDARPAGGGNARVVVAQDDPQRLYLGLEAGGIWTSADSGAHWARYGIGMPDAVAAIATVPTQPGGLYAIAESALYRCPAVGAHWERVEGVQPSGAALAILAGKQPVLLVSLEDGGVGRSDDGAAWTTVESDVDWSGDVTTIAAVRYHMDMAFAGTGVGQLMHSADRGRTWQMLKQGLAPIRSIAAARLA
jgi:hypothetical protein